MRNVLLTLLLAIAVVSWAGCSGSANDGVTVKSPTSDPSSNPPPPRPDPEFVEDPNTPGKKVKLN
jgi:hypothetical protein